MTLHRAVFSGPPRRAWEILQGRRCCGADPEWKDGGFGNQLKLARIVIVDEKAGEEAEPEEAVERKRQWKQSRVCAGGWRRSRSKLCLRKQQKQKG